MWSSEFTTKVATLQGDSAEIVPTSNVKLYLHQKNLLVARDQLNFVVCRWAAALKSGGNACHGLVGLRRDNARHGLRHVATLADGKSPHRLTSY